MLFRVMVSLRFCSAGYRSASRLCCPVGFPAGGGGGQELVLCF